MLKIQALIIWLCNFAYGKKLGMTVGFLPFSTVGYSISKTHDFEDVNNNGKWSESYDGDGGFIKFS